MLDLIIIDVKFSFIQNVPLSRRFENSYVVLITKENFARLLTIHNVDQERFIIAEKLIMFHVT